MTAIIIDRKIKDYRKTHKLTQVEFGEILGISPQAVSKWEKKWQTVLTEYVSILL